MATTKNITMKQFNGTDYDTLYPKTVYSQVSGVAPAGYGLGANTARLITDGNDALVGGWFYWKSNDTNLPFTYGHMRVDPQLMDETSGRQTLMQTAYSDSYSGCVAQRKLADGVWQPWEWVNPPMRLGVEYRTTERYQGKPVYVREIDCGSMPSAGGSKTVQAPYDGTDNPIKCAWIVHSYVTHYGQSMPSITYGGTPMIRAVASVNSVGTITIGASSSTDWTSNGTVYVTLKYIKNTD